MQNIVFISKMYLIETVRGLLHYIFGLRSQTLSYLRQINSNVVKTNCDLVGAVSSAPPLRRRAGWPNRGKAGVGQAGGANAA